ncbi:unnamed protein product, partial [Rhizoctonia solani]
MTRKETSKALSLKMAFNPEDIAYADIYPPINVARVGDSDKYFIGSEVPGVEPIPEGGFKDEDQKIKKQVDASCTRYMYPLNS